MFGACTTIGIARTTIGRWFCYAPH
jgi:hypothetical protein